MRYDLVKALRSLYPGSFWRLDGDTYEGLTWDESNLSLKPTKEELIEECIRLKAEYERTEYQRQRKPEYPSIGDQLDALFKAGLFPPEMAAKIQEVKDKYPKPE